LPNWYLGFIGLCTRLVLFKNFNKKSLRPKDNLQSSKPRTCSLITHMSAFTTQHTMSQCTCNQHICQAHKSRVSLERPNARLSGGRDHGCQSNLQPGPEDDRTGAHQLAHAMKRAWWMFKGGLLTVVHSSSFQVPMLTCDQVSNITTVKYLYLFG
jgi:hypothetical protein